VFQNRCSKHNWSQQKNNVAPVVLRTKVVFEVNLGADKSSTHRIQIVTNRFWIQTP